MVRHTHIAISLINRNIIDKHFEMGNKIKIAILNNTLGLSFSGLTSHDK